MKKRNQYKYIFILSKTTEPLRRRRRLLNGKEYNKKEKIYIKEEED